MERANGIPVAVRQLHPAAVLPQRATALAAGWDLCCVESLHLEAGQRTLVATGLAVALPPGTEIQIRPRSGLALKHGLTVLNAPGTIDADYRGEIKVLLINLGSEVLDLPAGSRIAQAVLATHLVADYHWVDELPPSDRGAGGFGHSG